MAKIDIKDRKILYQLDLNCRQSNAQIGKKIGLHRNKVQYRIKRMQNEKIITSFWTNIDSYRFGYDVYRYYIIFQNLTVEKKEEIINHLVNYKNSWVVGTIRGPYDLVIVLWVKNIPEFYQFWDDTNDKYGDYFAEKIFSVYIKADVYPSTYLIADECKRSDRDNYTTVGGKEKVEIDDIDYKILTVLSTNARIPLIELSEKMKCSSQTLQYHIKNLFKNGIIQAFRVNIDISKLNLQRFSLGIHLKDHSQRDNIMKFVAEKTHIEYNMESIGWSDMQFEIVVENIDHLMKIMEEISVKFPKAIRKQSFLIAEKNHKERWLPEL